MTNYKGKYIALASGVHGWAGSETVCATADSPLVNGHHKGTSLNNEHGDHK